MTENPEVALFMLCNPYNPVGEAPIDTESEGGGSRESEKGVGVFGVSLLER